jgi:hypothetical protein
MSLLNEYLALVVAVILILASLPVVYFLDRPRMIDHLSRTLVAIGVGLMAAFVAVTIFDLNAKKLESERNLAQQQARRSKALTLVSNLRYFAIQYGFAAYQIGETRSDCGPKSPDGVMSEVCREGANYAINVSRLMPADYAVITALSETSDAFARSVRVSTLLTRANACGDRKLRQRLRGWAAGAHPDPRPVPANVVGTGGRSGGCIGDILHLRGRLDAERQ